MSRNKAADRLGISVSMLAQYEEGRDVPLKIILCARAMKQGKPLPVPAMLMSRDRWVTSVDMLLRYGRGVPVVGALLKEGRIVELKDFLDLARFGPDPDLALTDPALFRALREAGTRAYLNGLMAFPGPEPVTETNEDADNSCAPSR